MLKYQQGDSAAFEELYSRHKNPLYAYLYRSHVDLSVIEEIAQETWIAVINAAEKYRASAKFKTYLYAIAHRKLVDFWRRSKLGLRLTPHQVTELDAFLDTLHIQTTQQQAATSPAADGCEPFQQAV